MDSGVDGPRWRFFFLIVYSFLNGRDLWPFGRRSCVGGRESHIDFFEPQQSSFLVLTMSAGASNTGCAVNRRREEFNCWHGGERAAEQKTELRLWTRKLGQSAGEVTMGFLFARFPLGEARNFRPVRWVFTRAPIIGERKKTYTTWAGHSARCLQAFRDYLIKCSFVSRYSWKLTPRLISSEMCFCAGKFSARHKS